MIENIKLIKLVGKINGNITVVVESDMDINLIEQYVCKYITVGDVNIIVK